MVETVEKRNTVEEAEILAAQAEHLIDEAQTLLTGCEDLARRLRSQQTRRRLNARHKAAQREWDSAHYQVTSARLAADEYERLVEAARHAGLTVSAQLRALVRGLQAVDAHEPDAEPDAEI